jgi:serine phosphatase RsbU (regulator of sigma subunit)
MSAIVAARRKSTPSMNDVRRLFENVYGAAVDNVPGLDIGRAYGGADPASPYGGDVVDVFRFGNGLTSIAVIDISGHGMHAATYAGLAKHALRAYASQGLDALDAVRALNHLCIETCAFERESEFFATAFFAIVDAQRRSMKYVAAGHEAACLVRGRSRRFLEPTGPMLGLCDDDQAFDQNIVALEFGDIIAAVTDGFTEARNAQLEFLGPGALADVIERNREEAAEALAHAIVLRAFTHGGRRLADDVAAAVLRIT